MLIGGAVRAKWADGTEEWWYNYKYDPLFREPWQTLILLNIELKLHNAKIVTFYYIIAESLEDGVIVRAMCGSHRP